MSLFSHHKGGRGAGGYPDRKRGAGNGGRHVKMFFLQKQKLVDPNINDFFKIPCTPFQIFYVIGFSLLDFACQGQGMGSPLNLPIPSH